MELRHLRYFAAVASEENVTRAAAKLHVSQPAVSRQIHDLEEELGVLLLERRAQSVHLTEAGRVFLGEARAVLQRAEEAVKSARAAAGGECGELQVGYAPSLTVQILPQALRLFQKDFPRVRVLLHDLSTGEMLAKLRAGEIHLALVVRPERAQMRGLVYQELASYPMCAAVAPKHPLASSRTLSLARVAREPLIAYSRRDYPEYHEGLKKLFAKAGGKLRIAEEHDGVTGLIAAVEAGHGIALVPSCLSCMAGPRLKLLPLTPGSPPISVGAARRAGDVSALAQHFIAGAGQERVRPIRADR